MTRRPPAPTEFPIDKPSTEEGKAAAKLHAAWVAQYERVDQVERDYRAARDNLRAADEALQDALAKAEREGKRGKAVADAEAAYTAAKEAVEAPWQQRARAALREAEARRADYNTYVDANLEALLAELRPEAEAAAKAVQEAAQALAAAFDRYRRSRYANEALIGPAQAIDNRAIPTGGIPAGVDRGVAELTRQAPPPPTPTRRHLDQRRIARGEEPVGNYGTDGGPNTIRLSP